MFFIRPGSKNIFTEQTRTCGNGQWSPDYAPCTFLSCAVDDSSDIDGDDLADALTRGLKLALGGDWSDGEYRSGEITEADWLEKERYTTDEWTWSK